MAFGVLNDYFGLADTKHQLQSSSLAPATGGNAQVQDSNGNTTCETVFGRYGVYECAYKITSYTSDTSGYVALNLDTDAMIGEIFAIDTATKAVVTGIGLELPNTEQPTLTITAEEYQGDASAEAAQPTFSSGITFLGIKRAQAIGFVPDTDSRVTSCSVSLSGQLDATSDSQGARVLTVVYQGRAEATGELAACTGTPGASAHTGWTMNAAVGTSEQNTGYGTASVAVFKNLAPSA